MKLIALKSIGRLRPGDDFEVRRSTEARVLKALGKAKDAPAPPPPEPVPRRRAEPAPEMVAAEPPARSVPRFYRRRDMAPEEN